MHSLARACLGFSLILFIASAVNAQSMTFDEVLAAYDASSKLVRSFDVAVEVNSEIQLSRTIDWSSLPPSGDGGLPRPKILYNAIPIPERSSRITRSRQRFQSGMFLLECREANGRQLEIR